MNLSMTPTRYVALGKFGFAAILTLAFCMTHPASGTYATNGKLAKYGTIKVQTKPGGLPLEIDGKSRGVTSTDYLALDLEPGLHTIVISLPNGQSWTREINVVAGRIKCLTLNYIRPGLPPMSPCPFPVNLSAPTTVNEGEIVTYTADVTYGGTAALNYRWTISPSKARILSGAATPTITVDSTGLANQRVIATLVVDDGSGDAACRRSAQASTVIPKQPPRENPAREFDVCSACSYDDLKARLDNLGIELQNDPSTTAYIIAYGGRTSRSGQADRLGALALDYLVAKRGINPSRIVVINGGFKEEDCVELWVVPSGANPPRPSPTVQAGDARPAPEPVSRRKRN